MKSHEVRPTLSGPLNGGAVPEEIRTAANFRTFPRFQREGARFRLLVTEAGRGTEVGHGAPVFNAINAFFGSASLASHTEDNGGARIMHAPCGQGTDLLSLRLVSPRFFADAMRRCIFFDGRTLRDLSLRSRIRQDGSTTCWLSELSG